MTSVNVPSSGSDNEANVEPDMTQTPGSFEATQDSVAPSVGQQLRAAREARGLTADDVAKAIKLSFRQVKALEADDWPNLPGKTIIRGFVRNYARLLTLDSSQLMTDLDQLNILQAPVLDIPTPLPVAGRPVTHDCDHRSGQASLAPPAAPPPSVPARPLSTSRAATARATACTNRPSQPE